MIGRRTLLSHQHVRSLALGVLGIAGWALLRPSQDDPSNYLSFGIMAAAALLPALLWALDTKRYAIPLFALYALSFLWSSAMPVLDRHPLIPLYSPTERIYSAAVVVLHLFAGLAAWKFAWRRPPKSPTNIWVLKSGTRLTFYYALLASSVAYELAFRAGYLYSFAQLLPILRAAFGSATMIAILMLAYRIGRGEGQTIHRVAFYALLVIYCVVTATGLLLVNAIIAIGATAFGLTLGSGRLPWKLLTFVLPVLAVLHLGKEQMRDYHWNYLGRWTVEIQEYPEFFKQWTEFGFERLAMDDEQSAFQSARSVVQRASLFHMTLRTAQMAGREVPYLLGESYAPVPLLLVPRFIIPDKPFSHEGTTLLNIHYGLQDREGTETTTIGWGLMNEAYANFGITGVMALGLLLGWIIGFVERLGKSMPLESVRMLYGFFFVGITINTEATMGVFLTTWFQGTVGLIFLLPFVERRSLTEP